MIAIQDAYIANICRYDVRGYNFGTLRTKAWRKAKSLFMEIGFTENQAHVMVVDANDMADLARICTVCRQAVA